MEQQSTLRRKRKTPDWLNSYNTTGLADLCADFDANEVDEVDFESESIAGQILAQMTVLKMNQVMTI